LDFKIKGKIAAPTSSISLSLNLITLFSSWWHLAKQKPT
jgi:hypothetical protein